MSYSNDCKHCGFKFPTWAICSNCGDSGSESELESMEFTSEYIPEAGEYNDISEHNETEEPIVVPKLSTLTEKNHHLVHKLFDIAERIELEMSKEYPYDSELYQIIYGLREELSSLKWESEKNRMITHFDCEKISIFLTWLSKKPKLLEEEELDIINQDCEDEITCLRFLNEEKRKCSYSIYLIETLKETLKENLEKTLLEFDKNWDPRKDIVCLMCSYECAPTESHITHYLFDELVLRDICSRF
jgi:hypothetical protein